MLEKRKKISKKQIKEDRLVTTYYEAITFYQKYQSKILIGIAAVALVVVAIVLYSNKKASDNMAAANLLGKVMPLYEAENFKEAIDGQKTGNIAGLKEIVDKYGSTNQGNVAKIFLGDCYAMTGNNDEAYKMYDDYSGSNPLFKATALAGKAACLEVKKEFDKAADLYKDASKISKENPSNSEFLLKAGIDLIQAGKKSEAKTIFETLKKDYKNTTEAYESDRYLIQIES
ncbi:MAG: hypothetical protein M1495_06115 [Bacteroidetes bacterium]|nr:hypothetical protein [Bacteroidota bacterium]